MAASSEHSFDILSSGEELVAYWGAQQWIDGIKCEQDWVRAFVQMVMKPRVF
jgi:hypothetical protein